MIKTGRYYKYFQFVSVANNFND